MPLDMSRRSFLKGLLATTVIASMPTPLHKLGDPIVLADVTPPPGMTYQWVRTALLGVPDPENVERRLKNGWQFVAPDKHPKASTATLEHAIEATGLVLMEKPTVEVEKSRAEEELKRRSAA